MTRTAIRQTKRTRHKTVLVPPRFAQVQTMKEIAQRLSIQPAGKERGDGTTNRCSARQGTPRPSEWDAARVVPRTTAPHLQPGRHGPRHVRIRRYMTGRGTARSLRRVRAPAGPVGVASARALSRSRASERASGADRIGCCGLHYCDVACPDKTAGRVWGTVTQSGHGINLSSGQKIRGKK